MMLSLASPVGVANNLVKYSLTSTNGSYVTVRYVLRGKPVCQPVFSLVVNVTICTLSSQASGVCTPPTFSV